MIDRIETEGKAIVGLYVNVIMLLEYPHYRALVGLGSGGSCGVCGDNHATHLRESITKKGLESFLDEALGAHTLLAEFRKDFDPAVVVHLTQDHG
jgi:hypothetical protein